jgi:putative Mn2+ efflux pump MntP
MLLLNILMKELVMDIATILIAFGLALDSFSVSITSGLSGSKTKVLKRAITVAIFFGVFQAFMLFAGWLAGNNIVNFISEFDHWMAFILLTFIGLRMIYESLKNGYSKRIINYSSMSILLMLSIATSIDALAVGLSLSFLNIVIYIPALLTGIIAFLLSFLGVYIGDKFGKFFGKKIEVIGGLILIAIGVNIVIEHIGI